MHYLSCYMILKPDICQISLTRNSTISIPKILHINNMHLIIYIHTLVNIHITYNNYIIHIPSDEQVKLSFIIGFMVSITVNDKMKVQLENNVNIVSCLIIMIIPKMWNLTWGPMHCIRRLKFDSVLLIGH